MSIKDDLKNALGVAMKTKDDVSKRSLRLALSAIKLAEVAKGEALEDMKIFNILQKEVKTKEETIAEATKAERSEMIAPLLEEIEVLKRFLPAELSDMELTEFIDKAITEQKATSIKQMGLVMKTVIIQVEGKASNDRISKIIKSKLAN